MIAEQPSSELQSLERRMCERQVRIDALNAEQARDLARFDEIEGWLRVGARDSADWATSNLGVDLPNARALLAAGQAAREFIEVGEAFHSGQLSVDKMKLLAPVVSAEDEAGWVETALTSSPAELARRCREHRSSQAAGKERDRIQRRQRRLHTWYDEMNMFRISGALPPDEGMMVQFALDRARQSIRTLRKAQHIVDIEPADHPFHAEQADALVWISTDAVLGEPGTAAPSSPVELVVHVDYDVLTGANPDGRGHIENGPALSTAALRRLGCDATVKTLIERNGEPIAAGREKPIISPAMKFKVRSRDGICQAPDCARPANHCEVHHIHHWADLGPTELWNLAALCKFHHQRHHDGEFDVHRTAGGDLFFVNHDGELMGMATGGHWKRPKNNPGP